MIMKKRIKGSKIAEIGKVELPKMTRNEKYILLGSRITEIAARFQNSALMEVDAISRRTKNLVTPKESKRIINQRQEDVITELLYPNGLTLAALMGESKHIATNPYTREATMKTLARLMSKGIISINKNSRIVLVPSKIVLTNHPHVDERFKESMKGSE